MATRPARPARLGCVRPAASVPPCQRGLEARAAPVGIEPGFRPPASSSGTIAIARNKRGSSVARSNLGSRSSVVIPSPPVPRRVPVAPGMDCTCLRPGQRRGILCPGPRVRPLPALAPGLSPGDAQPPRGGIDGAVPASYRRPHHASRTDTSERRTTSREPCSLMSRRRREVGLTDLREVAEHVRAPDEVMRCGGPPGWVGPGRHPQLDRADNTAGAGCRLR